MQQIWGKDHGCSKVQFVSLSRRDTASGRCEGACSSRPKSLLVVTETLRFAHIVPMSFGRATLPTFVKRLCYSHRGKIGPQEVTVKRVQALGCFETSWTAWQTCICLLATAPSQQGNRPFQLDSSNFSSISYLFSARKFNISAKSLTFSTRF